MIHVHGITFFSNSLEECKVTSKSLPPSSVAHFPFPEVMAMKIFLVKLPFKIETLDDHSNVNASSSLFSAFLKKLFCRSIVDLQYCVSFRCTAK